MLGLLALLVQKYRYRRQPRRDMLAFCCGSWSTLLYLLYWYKSTDTDINRYTQKYAGVLLRKLEHLAKEVEAYMYIYIYIYLHTYIHKYICLYICLYLCLYMPIYMHV